jgi:hypothetical protein
VYKDNAIYNVIFDENGELYNWLYSSNSEDKILLRKLIHQAGTVNADIYSRVSDEIATRNCSTPKAFLDMYYVDESILRLRNADDVAKTYCNYLLGVKTAEQFMEIAERCFPGIHFHQDVRKTLNTLKDPLHMYVPEICKHLLAIEAEFKTVYDEHREQGLTMVTSIFQAKTQIACSCEGNPERARKKLSFPFISDSGDVISIVCEPHTKLINSHSPDRIYFHQGREDIQNGKVLIAYIGKHL